MKLTATGGAVLAGASLAFASACSAVLGIGDWVDLTDGGSGNGDAASDVSSRDAPVRAEGSVDATPDHHAASDAARHDAADAFSEADDGKNAVIDVLTTSLDFNGGDGGVGVACGTTAPLQNVMVQNTGTGNAEITALALGLGNMSPYTVPGVPILVRAGMTVPIPIAPNPVLSKSPPAANLNDTLTVTTNAKGDMPHVVTLIETSAGAALSLSPTTIAFSLTATGAKATDQLSLTNSGNIDAPVVFSSGGNTAFTFDAPVTALKGTNTFPNAYFSPTMAEPYNSTGSVTVVADAGVPLCSRFDGSDGSISFQLSGTGTTSNTYAVAPASLPFGNNTCGAPAPAAKTVTVTNDAIASTTWTATLSGSGSGLFDLSAGSGMVNGSGATSTFTVTPTTLSSTSGLTAGDIQSGVSATLTVIVGMGGSAETFTIPVSETPVGAFPSWSSTSLTLTGPESTGTVELENAASLSTSFTLKSSSTSFPVSPASGPSSSGVPLTLTVTDKTLTGAGSATITPSLTTPSAPLCGPLPAALIVTGKL